MYATWKTYNQVTFNKIKTEVLAYQGWSGNYWMTSTPSTMKYNYIIYRYGTSRKDGGLANSTCPADNEIRCHHYIEM